MDTNEFKFDPKKASGLQRDLSQRLVNMRNTLNDIKTSVNNKTKNRWVGASADAYKNLCSTSSENALAYLKSWLDSVNTIIAIATEEQARQETAETSAIDAAKAGLTKATAI